MSAAEHELEPIPGLPQRLPEGEAIVWQGAPEWRSLARQAFKVPWLLAYFGVLTAARIVVGVSSGDLASTLWGTLVMGSVFACSLGLCVLLAWLQARATVYTITNRRVVMRIGAALPITWNLPFARMASAAVFVRGDDDGDIVLDLIAPDRVAWFHLWPHARPDKRFRARPTLRCVDQPQVVARALRAAARQWSQADADGARLAFGTLASDAEASANGRVDSARTPSNTEPPRTAPEAALQEGGRGVPRGALLAAGGLLLASLGLAAHARTTHSSAPVSPSDSHTAIGLRFEDRADGSVGILDAASGHEDDVVPPTQGGFVRGVLRGMFRARRLDSIDPAAHFTLTRQRDGALVLADPYNGRRVDLRSFGATNYAAFARVLSGTSRTQ